MSFIHTSNNRKRCCKLLHVKKKKKLNYFKNCVHIRRHGQLINLNSYSRQISFYFVPIIFVFSKSILRIKFG